MNEILQKTYDVLEERGWCQGEMVQPDGKVCLEGAFTAAVQGRVLPRDCAASLTNGDPEIRQAWMKLRQAILEETGHHRGIWLWNDAPDRTVEDVKLVLKKAINS